MAGETQKPRASLGEEEAAWKEEAVGQSSTKTVCASREVSESRGGGAEARRNQAVPLLLFFLPLSCSPQTPQLELGSDTEATLTLLLPGPEFC